MAISTRPVVICIEHPYGKTFLRWVQPRSVALRKGCFKRALAETIARTFFFGPQPGGGIVLRVEDEGREGV